MNLFLFTIMHSVPDYYASICGSNSIVFRLHLSLPCAYFKLFCNPTVQGFNIPRMGRNICIWRHYLNFSATSFQVRCKRKNCFKKKSHFSRNVDDFCPYRKILLTFFISSARLLTKIIIVSRFNYWHGIIDHIII